MTEEQIALAKRAVACRGWRWMEGMGVVDGDGLKNRVARVDAVDMYGDGVEVVPWEMVHRLVADSCCSQWREHGILPDLTDPATLGCLLALVREAWRYASAHPMPWGHSKFRPEPVGWAMLIGADDTLPNSTLSAPTEAEALVAALEAAP